MTPLQQLRIWLRRASVIEQALTGVALVVVVALTGWLVAPVLQGSSSETLQAAELPSGSSDPSPGATATATGSGGTTGGTGGTSGATSGASTSTSDPAATGGTGGTTGSAGLGATGASGTTGATGTSTTGGTTGATTSGGGTTGPAKNCPGGTDQGVTASKVGIAITLVDIGGAVGNGALGVPSPTEQQADWQQVTDSINASGGAGCRTLVPHFYAVNPVDSNAAQSQCLKIAADKPFLTLDVGALTQVGASDCIPGQKIPLISQYITGDQAKTYYPYYLSPTGIQERGYKSNYLGAMKKGYFGAGFKKLGVVYQNCRPKIVAAGRAAIRAAGIPDSAVVEYNLSCPAGRQTSPVDYQSAAVAFKRAGVTHVTDLEANDFPSFTKAAAQQNYKPTYVLAEDDKANAQSGALAPDAKNFDGAVDVIGGGYGEQNTPGFKRSAATARCDALYAKHGQKPVYQQGAGFGGVVCHYLWFAKELLDHAPAMQRTALASGMRSIGRFDGVFPFGPIDFAASGARDPYGVESWRVVKFNGGCACWKVLSPAFNPPFT